jgi:hypothetical protein
MSQISTAAWWRISLGSGSQVIEIPLIMFTAICLDQVNAELRPPGFKSVRDSDAYGGHAVRALCSAAPVSLSETPYSWRTGANRVMLLRDDPTAQIALWCAHWTVPVQRAA